MSTIGNCIMKYRRGTGWNGPLARTYSSRIWCAAHFSIANSTHGDAHLAPAATSSTVQIEPTARKKERAKLLNHRRLLCVPLWLCVRRFRWYCSVCARPPDGGKWRWRMVSGEQIISIEQRTARPNAEHHIDCNCFFSCFFLAASQWLPYFKCHQMIPFMGDSLTHVLRSLLCHFSLHQINSPASARTFSYFYVFMVCEWFTEYT